MDREFRAPDDNAQSFSALAGLACVVPLCIFIALLNYLTAVSMAALLILEIIFLTAAFAFNSAEVIVNAGKDNLTVKKLIFRNTVLVKKYKYDEIESAECELYAFRCNRGRWGTGIGYALKAEIKLKSWNPLRFRKVIHGLHNPNDLKQYKMFVENDDMLCLFEFVKNKKTKACP